jgi:REP element-mobilizing transposase RayT
MTHYLPTIMKVLKGGSVRFLYKKFPNSKIKNGDSLWDQKYLIATEGKQLDEMINRYTKQNLFKRKTSLKGSKMHLNEQLHNVKISTRSRRVMIF